MSRIDRNYLDSNAKLREVIDAVNELYEELEKATETQMPLFKDTDFIPSFRASIGEVDNSHEPVPSE